MRRLRHPLRFAWIVWVTALIAGVGFVGLLVGVGTEHSPFCDGRTDSNYGDLRWESMPPGFYCSWSRAENGYDVRDDASWRMPTYLVVMGASGLFLTKRTRRRAL
jgi:hypothetical protein